MGVGGRAQGIAPTMDGFACRGVHGGKGTFLSLHPDIMGDAAFIIPRMRLRPYEPHGRRKRPLSTPHLSRPYGYGGASGAGGGSR
jgi:hypothetical protein